MTVRLMARLDIKGPNLVKGVRMEGLRVLGKPEGFALRYYQEGIDELIYVDSVASLYGRNKLIPIVEQTARNLFIPLTVGGGLRSVEDIRDVLRAGADKVALNTAAIKDPDLIRRASRKFGSSAIVISIPVMYSAEKECYVVYSDYGRQDTEREAREWAQQAVDLGAGEVMLTSVDREGTGQGLDTNFARIIVNSVPVPVILGGGAGRLSHVAEGPLKAGVNGVCLASMLHYKIFNEMPKNDLTHRGNGNPVLLNNKSVPKEIQPATIREIKKDWAARGILVRPV